VIKYDIRNILRIREIKRIKAKKKISWRGPGKKKVKKKQRRAERRKERKKIKIK
jgi:hypothetical protein